MQKKLVGIATALIVALNTVGVFCRTDIDAAQKKEFVHPGILCTQETFDRIDSALKSNKEDWEKTVAMGYDALSQSSYCNFNYSPRAVNAVVRGGDGDNVARLYTDLQRAYQCALKWKISKDDRYGITSCKILNTWAKTLMRISGNADRYLAAGIFGYQMANTAEIMREHPLMDNEAMSKMLLEVFYPLNSRFLYGTNGFDDHNDAHDQNYWANWDLCNMASAMAIGIYCDNEEIFDKVIDYYQNGSGNGSIYRSIPYVFDDGTGQWQESGRDQGHTQLGVGLMASVCEMAWNQGVDLYSWAGNRLMYGAEGVAKYNNGHDVRYESYEHFSGQKGSLAVNGTVSNAGRGEYRAVWEMLYNHYHNRMGFDVPNIAQRAEKMRPEGGAYAGGHATVHDQPGFGTLMYTIPEGYGCTREVHSPEEEAVSGIYEFTAQHSGMLMTEVNAAVVQRSRGEYNSRWNVIHLGGGVYKILSNKSGLAFTVKEGAYSNGAELVLEEYEGRTEQKFTFVSVDGSFMILPFHSGKPLGVRNMDLSEGAVVNQYMETRNPNQVWSVEIKEELPEEKEEKLYKKAEPIKAPADEPNNEIYAVSGFESIYIGAVFTNKAVMEFDITPLVNNTNAVVGFCGFENIPDYWNKFNMAVRINESGQFDVRDNNAYRSGEAIFYEAGNTYRIVVETDVTAQKYDVYVDGKTLIKGAGYRSDAPPARNIARYSVICGDGMDEMNMYIANFTGREVERANILYPDKKFDTIQMDEPMQGVFEVKFDIKPFEYTDGFIGITGNMPVTWGDYIIGVRLQPDGTFDAMDKDTYRRVNVSEYTPGEIYTIRITANQDNMTYNVYVSKKGGAEIIVAEQFGYRESADTSLLPDKISVLAGTGGEIDDFAALDIEYKMIKEPYVVYGKNTVWVYNLQKEATLFAAEEKEGGVGNVYSVKIEKEGAVDIGETEAWENVSLMLWDEMTPLCEKKRYVK